MGATERLLKRFLGFSSLMFNVQRLALSHFEHFAFVDVPSIVPLLRLLTNNFLVTASANGCW